MNNRVWMVSALMVGWLFVVISSLMVVYCKHVLRNKVSELQMLNDEWDSVQVEWGQLLLEKGTMANYERIEKYAIDELGMQRPKFEDMIRFDANKVDYL